MAESAQVPEPLPVLQALPDLSPECPPDEVPSPIPARYHAATRHRITLSARGQNVMAAMLERMIREGWVDLLAMPDESELIEIALEHAARSIAKTRWDSVAEDSKQARGADPLPTTKARGRKPKS